MATIVLSAAKVIEAANAAIQNLQNDIDCLRAEKAALVADFIKRTGKVMDFKASFPFVYFRAATVRDYAFSDELDAYGVIFRIEAKKDRISEIQKLLLVAQYGDPVTLNEDDVALLFGGKN
jgi:hypothetical protein